MTEKPRAVDYHIGKITKKYIIDFLNALLFSNAVLWDGDDQFNELPIFETTTEEGLRTEQRGALFVNRKNSKALRLSVVATETTIQRVCYRISGLHEPLRINEDKRLYYPLDGIVIDVSIADLNLGNSDPASYSFSDNTNSTGRLNNERIFTVLRYLLNSVFITIEEKEIFADLLDHHLSLPPLPSDPHFKPVYGVRDAVDNCID
jgi:hypothetical protein